MKILPRIFAHIWPQNPLTPFMMIVKNEGIGKTPMVTVKDCRTRTEVTMPADVYLELTKQVLRTINEAKEIR